MAPAYPPACRAKLSKPRGAVSAKKGGGSTFWRNLLLGRLPRLRRLARLGRVRPLWRPPRGPRLARLGRLRRLGSLHGAAACGDLLEDPVRPPRCVEVAEQRLGIVEAE